MKYTVNYLCCALTTEFGIGSKRCVTTTLVNLCIGQIEASTSPPPGIPRAFDTFAVPGRREFDYICAFVANWLQGLCCI